MNAKYKFITIEEKTLNLPETAESVVSRKFKLEKFNAKTSIKLAKLLSAKILPVFDQFIALMSGGADIANMGVNEILKRFSVTEFSKALDLISDEDLDKLIDVALKHCYECLGAGETKVLNNDGTFGVVGAEDDPVLVLRIVIETVWFSLEGFFDGNRLRSVLTPLAGSFGLGTPM